MTRIRIKSYSEKSIKYAGLLTLINFKPSDSTSNINILKTVRLNIYLIVIFKIKIFLS